MNYRDRNQAIGKIARELGRTMGTHSMPKIFPQLSKGEGPYKIPKETHINQLLKSCKSRNDRFETLQKIFSVHASLDKTIVEELKPALNKLGFTFKNGIIIELTTTRKPTLKAQNLSTTKKYAKKSTLISESIFHKGDKLSSAYLTVYLIENHLRLFIWKISGRSNRKLSKLLGEREKTKIADRHSKEKLSKWLSLRKDSNLFYLDIEDLGSIIQRNWSIFQNYFPDQSWICTKIDEVGAIRNRIAHSNSFISELEKKVLVLYMEQIFEQIK